jgi:hypothetical protein
LTIVLGKQAGAREDFISLEGHKLIKAHDNQKSLPKINLFLSLNAVTS